MSSSGNHTVPAINPSIFSNLRDSKWHNISREPPYRPNHAWTTSVPARLSALSPDPLRKLPAPGQTKHAGPNHAKKLNQQHLVVKRHAAGGSRATARRQEPPTPPTLHWRAPAAWRSSSPRRLIYCKRHPWRSGLVRLGREGDRSSGTAVPSAEFALRRKKIWKNSHTLLSKRSPGD